MSRRDIRLRLLGALVAILSGAAAVLVAILLLRSGFA
jgi:hypothetical protein